jgi:hypothetical protein
VINLQPDKEDNFRVRAGNKYGCSEPTSLVQLRRRAGKFSLYAEKYVNDQIVMMPEIFVIYVCRLLESPSQIVVALEFQVCMKLEHSQ